MSRRFCRATDLTSFTAAAPTAGDVGKFLYVSAAGVVSYTSQMITDGTFVQIGTTPATAGAIRLENNVSIQYRDNADSANIIALKVNSGDSLEHGYGCVDQRLYAGTVTVVTVEATGFSFGQAISALVLKQANRNAGNPGNSLTLRAQSTTDSQTAGTLYLDGGVSTGGTHGGVSVRINSVALAAFSGAYAIGIGEGTYTNGVTVTTKTGTAQLFKIASTTQLELGETASVLGNQTTMLNLYYDTATSGVHVLRVNGGECLTVGGTYAAIGSPSSTATAGALRIPNSTALYSRNAAGSDNLRLIYSDNTDAVAIGDAAVNGITYTTKSATTHSFVVNATAALTVGTGYLTVGPAASAAATGAVRVANTNGLVSRNAAGTGDVTIGSVNPSNQVSVGYNGAGINLLSATTVEVVVGTSYVSLTSAGAAVATAGQLRGTAAFSLYGLDGSANNLPIITVSGGTITFGGNTYAAGIAYRTKDATAHTFYVNNIVKLTLNATGVGVFTATPVAQKADMGALTDSTGGSADGTLAAISGSGADADINNNFADLAAKVNAIRTCLSATAGGFGWMA